MLIKILDFPLIAILKRVIHPALIKLILQIPFLEYCNIHIHLLSIHPHYMEPYQIKDVAHSSNNYNESILMFIFSLNTQISNPLEEELGCFIVVISTFKVMGSRLYA